MTHGKTHKTAKRFVRFVRFEGFVRRLIAFGQTHTLHRL
jgi:hypothetical protein